MKARYHLPLKAIKSDCPQCGPRHRKTLSRFVDGLTGEPLPDIYGRCDRESNCGYFFSPYDKSLAGTSYADEQKDDKIPKEWFQQAGASKRQGATRQAVLRSLMELGATLAQAEQVTQYIYKTEPVLSIREVEPPKPVYNLPYKLFKKTLSHYEYNDFARFLTLRFGTAVAVNLLQRFHVGTSSHWLGACVFWLIDEQNRIRGGQVCLYDKNGHKAKYIDWKGCKRVCITSVRYALNERYKGYILPEWLTTYFNDAETWPVVFGLPQLNTVPLNQPVALVEGPKTAIVCSHYLPDFVWLAVGGKSYLKPERLAKLKGRKIMLYPDLNAYVDWQKRAEELRSAGFDVTLSDLLEGIATEEDRQNGLDIADYLLREPNVIRTFSEWLPGQLVTPDESLVEKLVVTCDDDYPVEWDE
jgi:hypothetical protein